MGMGCTGRGVVAGVVSSADPLLAGSKDFGLGFRVVFRREGVG